MCVMRLGWGYRSVNRSKQCNDTCCADRRVFEMPFKTRGSRDDDKEEFDKHWLFCRCSRRACARMLKAEGQCGREGKKATNAQRALERRQFHSRAERKQIRDWVAAACCDEN